MVAFQLVWTACLSLLCFIFVYVGYILTNFLLSGWVWFSLCSMYVELNAKEKLCYGWAEQVLISTPIKRHMVPQRMKSVMQETSVTLWLGLMVSTHNLFVLFFLEQQLMVGSSADSVACLHSFGIVKPTFGLFNPFSGVAEVTITDTQVNNQLPLWSFSWIYLLWASWWCIIVMIKWYWLLEKYYGCKLEF